MAVLTLPGWVQRLLVVLKVLPMVVTDWVRWDLNSSATTVVEAISKLSRDFDMPTVVHIMRTDRENQLISGLVARSTGKYTVKDVADIAFTIYSFWTAEEYAEGIATPLYAEVARPQVNIVTGTDGLRAVYVWVALSKQRPIGDTGIQTSWNQVADPLPPLPGDVFYISTQPDPRYDPRWWARHPEAGVMVEKDVLLPAFPPIE